MIRFLHENGAGLNNVNDKGRTSLMEAALWGMVGRCGILACKRRRREPRGPEGKEGVVLCPAVKSYDENERETWSLYRKQRGAEQPKNYRYQITVFRTSHDRTGCDE
jgi:hypothetical protein